jgi:SWI/SNF-related matrix-associated actin-dependent regulator of chromatin subfamily A member 5
LERKEEYIKQGFPEWSRRDFQQLVRGLETNGWYELPVLSSICPENDRFCRNATSEQLAMEIQDKSADEIEAYLRVFLKKCRHLAG